MQSSIEAAITYLNSSFNIFCRSMMKQFLLSKLWSISYICIVWEQFFETWFFSKLQDAEELQKMQIVQINDRKLNSRDNLAHVVLSPEMCLDVSTDTDADLMEALEGKYDALRDKLLAEALIKQVRVTHWSFAVCVNLSSTLCEIIRNVFSWTNSLENQNGRDCLNWRDKRKWWSWNSKRGSLEERESLMKSLKS